MQHYWIQEFPSQQFYGGKLRCGNGAVQTDASLPAKNFWPAGSRKPIVFCHIEGIEETQYITTDTAGTNSHFNMDEVKHVVNIYFGISRLRLVKFRFNQTMAMILSSVH